MKGRNKQDLTRASVRAQEIRNSSTDADTNAAFDTHVAAPMATFVAAEQTEAVAKRDVTVKRAAMRTALAKADQPSRFARALIALSDPAAELPPTLKAAPTPTEAMVYLKALQAILALHHGEAFADGLMAGQFGATSADAIAKIEAFDAATTALIAARTARTDAGNALYPVLLAFKDLLRHGTPATASAYPKLRLRAQKGAPAESPQPEAPAPDAAPRPTNGAGAPTVTVPTTAA